LKTLDRYVLRELAVPFMIGTLLVVLMFQANTYIALAKNLHLDNVPFVAVLQVILYQAPTHLALTLPVGMALAAALAMSRLTRESELTAVRAAGGRVMRVVGTVVAFGLIVAIGNFYLVERVIPPSMKRAKEIGVQVGFLGSMQSFRSNTMLNLGQFTASFGTMQRMEDDSLLIGDTLVVERPEPGVTVFYSAEEGTYRSGEWRFPHAMVRIFKGDDLVQMKVEDLHINEQIVLDELFLPPEPEEQSREDLIAAIETAKRVGGNPKRLEIAYHVKYAVPASCFIFALVAPIFAILFARSGAFAGVLVSFVMVLIYYNAFVISTQILGKVDSVPAWLAAWLPNILYAFLGILAIRRLE
jgi:LPS export ABC transporter permease LptG